MRLLLWFVFLAASAAQAEIYRCDTPEGPVFSDQACGDEATSITLDEDSSGISGGPPEEVRESLAAKRQAREEARARQREQSARRSDREVIYLPGDNSDPVFWPGRGYPNRPNRPPRPEHPVQPTPRPPDTLRPRGRGRN